MGATEKISEKANSTANSMFGKSHKEGPVAKTIENQTAKMPSDLFLWTAFGCIAGAAILKGTGRDNDSQFVGQWAPTILLLGLYNKIVKIWGND